MKLYRWILSIAAIAVLIVVARPLSLQAESMHVANGFYFGEGNLDSPSASLSSTRIMAKGRAPAATEAHSSIPVGKYSPNTSLEFLDDELLPWHLSIAFLREEEKGRAAVWKYCGGVLIDPSFVVTAASCLGESPKGLMADPGYPAPRRTNRGRYYNIDSVTIHPGFNHKRPSAQNDIALLHLRDPLPILIHVPLPIPDIKELPSEEFDVREVVVGISGSGPDKYHYHMPDGLYTQIAKRLTGSSFRTEPKGEVPFRCRPIKSAPAVLNLPQNNQRMFEPHFSLIGLASLEENRLPEIPRPPEVERLHRSLEPRDELVLRLSPEAERCSFSRDFVFVPAHKAWLTQEMSRIQGSD